MKSNKLYANCFCRKCGNKIDPTTKKCIGCGKQYFKGFRFYLSMIFSKKGIPLFILSVILISSIICNIVQVAGINDYENIIESQQNTIVKQKNTIEYKNNMWVNEYLKRTELESKLSFYEERIVIVSDDGTYLYHKYGCEEFNSSSFLMVDIKLAKDTGYVPHENCCG